MTIRDDVHKALDEHAARSHGDICDDTGLESVQVKNALNQLRIGGQAKRTAEGWIRVGKSPSAPAISAPLSASIEREREAIADAPAAPKAPAPLPAVPTKATAPAKRTHKKKPAKVEPIAVSRGNALIKAVNGALSFALTEAREIAIERRDGSGQRAFISSHDALRLADFIQLVQPALVGA